MIYVAGGLRNEACAGHRWLIQQHIEFGKVASGGSYWNLFSSSTFIVHVSKWIILYIKPFKIILQLVYKYEFCIF